MKNWVILIGLVAILLLLVGCTQNPSGNALLGLDANNDSNTNTNDSNTNIFNNLDDFKKAKVGDDLDLHYNLRLEDGTLLQSSYDSAKPFNIVLGKTSLIKGFEEGLIGMKVGETKFVTIPPEQGYGNYNANLVRTYDKNSSDLSGLGPFFVGMELNSTSGVVKVIEVNDNNVVIDFNHKLAGKTLIFEITLISINN